VIAATKLAQIVTGSGIGAAFFLQGAVETPRGGLGRPAFRAKVDQASKATQPATGTSDQVTQEVEVVAAFGEDEGSGLRGPTPVASYERVHKSPEVHRL